MDAADTDYDLHELIAAKPTDVDRGFAAFYQDIVKTRRLIPDNLVAFAVDSGGNYYAVHRDDGSVWYIDMEATKKGALPPPKQIAKSLDAFLAGGREDDDDDDD